MLKLKLIGYQFHNGRVTTTRKVKKGRDTPSVIVSTQAPNTSYLDYKVNSPKVTSLGIPPSDRENFRYILKAIPQFLKTNSYKLLKLIFFGN